MKKCSYCGREYPDDAVRCSIDEFPLSGGETLEQITVKASPLPVETKGFVVTERQMEIIEVVLVCVLAFGVSIFGSILFLFDENIYADSTRSAYSWAAQLLREGACVGLLWYLLRRRGRTFSDLGLRWSLNDFGWSLILGLAGSVVFHALYHFIYFSGIVSGTREASNQSTWHLLFGGGIFFSTIVIQFVNPFFEELIVRAYLVTQVKRITNSVTRAVVISTVLQASYHLYQGAPAAVAHGATFLIFSIYYAKTNRITPVILAHLYSDVGGTLEYWLRHG